MNSSFIKGPYALMSVEDEQRFAICHKESCAHLAYPVTKLSQENFLNWTNKHTKSGDMWRKVASDREQATAQLFVDAPELHDHLTGIVREMIFGDGTDASFQRTIDLCLAAQKRFGIEREA
jgi:hypothetical protein